MRDLLLADTATVTALQFPEDEGGENGECAQHHQGLVDTVNHLPLIRVIGGNEECSR